jgi:hypothetical protein
VKSAPARRDPGLAGSCTKFPQAPPTPEHETGPSSPRWRGGR